MTSEILIWYAGNTADFPIAILGTALEVLLILHNSSSM